MFDLPFLNRFIAIQFYNKLEYLELIDSLEPIVVSKVPYDE